MTATICPTHRRVFVRMTIGARAVYGCPECAREQRDDARRRDAAFADEQRLTADDVGDLSTVFGQSVLPVDAPDVGATFDAPADTTPEPPASDFGGGGGFDGGGGGDSF